MDAYIPESYIQDAAGRIEAYKRIAAVAAREDADDVLDELRDRYGKVPASVAGLVDISLARVLAAQLGIYEVTQKRDDLILYSDALDLAAVKRLLRGTARRMMVNASAKPYLSGAGRARRKAAGCAWGSAGAPGGRKDNFLRRTVKSRIIKKYF